ncbi:hypothetical protein LINGRAHAP2_LOCUS27823 [Linum grandiflorum]
MWQVQMGKASSWQGKFFKAANMTQEERKFHCMVFNV